MKHVYHLPLGLFLLQITACSDMRFSATVSVPAEVAKAQAPTAVKAAFYSVSAPKEKRVETQLASGQLALIQNNFAIYNGGTPDFTGILSIITDNPDAQTIGKPRILNGDQTYDLEYQGMLDGTFNFEVKGLNGPTANFCVGLESGERILIQRMFFDSTKDGAVSLTDFLEFRNNYGMPNLFFDATGDGYVDLQDFLGFRNTYGFAMSAIDIEKCR